MPVRMERREDGVTTLESVANIEQHLNKEDDHQGDGKHGDQIEFAALLGFQIEQHDNEEEQHHDRSAVDQDLNDSQEEGVQGDVESGQPEKADDQTQGAGDRATINDHHHAEEQHDGSKRPKERGGPLSPFFCSPLKTSPS